MGANTSIVTATAKQVTQQSVTDYGAGVFAHVNGDWSSHNVMAVLTSGGTSVPYLDSAAAKAGLDTIRMLLTDTVTNGDQAVVCPATPVGGSVLAGQPPIIVLQPQSQSVPPGTTVQFLVGAISDISISYQWRKNSASINGATATTLVLPNVQSGDAGNYDVFVSNANGSVVSSTGTLQVSSSFTGGDDDGFFESLPHVKIFKSLFG